ncbi:NAD(P)/FAD-dependent oxidoreductase [Pseudonocardia acaciae]|uniref:NAD(P)/FAD-dependent oxidoreductase n=1 Tax=Pseudonocardia acaciae TaxID=551276 RepID=UPI0007E8CABB|nr:FAD-dependent oxidoreductase [Pseudonocardia acaciae]
MSTADVVVLGAGIVGASCAYHLAARGRRVVVLERRDGPAQGSTGRSNACVRAQWTDPTNIALSWGGIQAYRDFEARHGVDVGYRPFGYLLLVPEHRWDDHLRAMELQRSMGVPVSAVTVAEAGERIPLTPTGLAGATWCPADGGVDPHLATTAYLGMARQHGARVLARSPAVTIEHRGDRWAVRTPDAVVEATAVVNATGGWAGEVAGLAGLTVPVHHSRRMIFASAPVPDRSRVPMTIDLTTGFFIRGENGRLLMGYGGSHEPPVYNDSLDWDWLERVMLAGIDRFPWLGDLPMDRAASWAGTYEVTPDHLPFVGAMPGAEGWFNACGFSGHGVMQAPMAGLLVAEEVVDGRAHTIDIDTLRIERLCQLPGQPPGQPRAGAAELVF